MAFLDFNLLEPSSMPTARQGAVFSVASLGRIVTVGLLFSATDITGGIGGIVRNITNGRRSVEESQSTSEAYSANRGAS
jgi:hypothetical protein